MSPDGRRVPLKLLSEKASSGDAVLAGIRRLLGLRPDDPIPSGAVETVRMGTTVATNALLERRGTRTLLVVNRGFHDLLRIGDQSRPDLFALAIADRPALHERVLSIAGRLDVSGREIESLDPETLLAALRDARRAGIESCAIALLHGWRHPDHERAVAALAREAGFRQVFVSHEADQRPRLVPRAATTVADGYLTPTLRRHVAALGGSLPGTRLLFMQSHGGLVSPERFDGKGAILSGPAGGMVGAARTAAAAGHDRIVAFDMGGTSTDVSLFEGRFEHCEEGEIDGIRLRVPALAIHTVAAGGGSILRFDGTRLRAGPESAGALPGPACYRNGGPVTVTDANLVLGRLQPGHFPALFGPNGDQPLDADAAEAGFGRIAAEIEAATGRCDGVPALAEGFLRIAVLHMANAVRAISVAKGRALDGFALQSFGGAGGQHACLVAEELGLDTVLVHPQAGLLSALGMGLADQSLLRERAVERPFTPEMLPELDGIAIAMADDATLALQEDGAEAGALRRRTSLLLRHAGADAALEIPLASAAEVRAAFEHAHRERFGFAPSDPALVVQAVRVIVTLPGPDLPATTPSSAPSRPAFPAPIDQVILHHRGERQVTPVFARGDLRPGHEIRGPALIREEGATTVLDPGWTGEVLPDGMLRMRRWAAAASLAGASEAIGPGAADDEAIPGVPVAGATAGDTPMIAAAGAGSAPPEAASGTNAFSATDETDATGSGPEHTDPAALELFNNMFRSVADQMGEALRSTARSVNIKERLDFSCAVFDRDGWLIANAPHVPVHLGAMGESVRHVIARRGASLRPGDAVALNDPFNGGTHLPDITVVTPVFAGNEERPRFFLGSRGHHADVGGITPGSIPPFSTALDQEGVVLDDVLLMRGGRLLDAEMRAHLAGGPFPARDPDTNIADMLAQIAANEAGAADLRRLAARQGWTALEAGADAVIRNGEDAVRRLLRTLPDGQFDTVLDDGTPLRVAIRMDRAVGAATIDFAGTGNQRPGNLNAPPAVVRASVLFVLRCLLRDDIPLNDGCLRPVTLCIPEGSFLRPRPGTAVVSGNTEISQAVAGAILGALGAAASSQGTMNNLTFGNPTCRYYETIAGGTGAGPGFAGASAVHSHMTNTRMTDPEIMEMRLPVRVEEFSVRAGSGGAGRWPGGDGAVRRLRFTEPVEAMLVSSRRTVPPFGLAGGSEGAPGRQRVERADGRIETLPGVFRTELAVGDVLVIETPGGGGFGSIAD
ncbi:hydantoinase B/oxoprolinase family protein [Acetobacteraceae bacterium KSS12]|uniref:Hydantoinase B/oxoprolinase family protein n=1 Tax=Rhizosaccharibacter radicis TaxID=2782605 RepID=A0ABT1VVV0_9PROT|nr:hydantoinase B/oxoprolinase family protein [Acetobacteraceae bacterium KSS12]